MRDYLLILGTQTAMSWRRFGRGGRQTMLMVLGLVFEIGFAAFITAGARSTFHSVRQFAAEYPQLVAGVEHNLLSMWALFTVVIILSNALNTTYASLYRSEDTGFLLSMPLSAKSVFAARLTGNMLSYVVVSFPITYGPYLAYGLAHGAGPAYHVVVAVAYLGFLSLVVAAAALFITAVMAFVPGARLKQWLMVLGLGMGLLLVVGSQMVASGLDGGRGPLGIFRGIGELRLGAFSLLPHVWLARTAEGALRGQGTGFMALTLLSAAAASVLLISFASRVYVIGWAGGQEIGRRRGGRPRRTAQAADLAGRSALACPFWAVLRKDLTIALRTPIQWYLVAVGVIIAAFQVINVARGSPGQGPVSEGARLLLVGLLLVGASFSASVIAGSAFSREGGNLQLVCSWPVRPAALFGGKVAAALPVTLAVATAGLVAVGLLTPVGLDAAWRYFPAMLLTAIPMLSLMACVDTLFPDFQYERGFEPGTSGSAGSVIKTLVSIYGGIATILLLMGTLGFPAYYGRLAWAQGMPVSQARTLAYLAFGLESAGLTLGSLAIGSRRIPGLVQRDAGRG